MSVPAADAGPAIWIVPCKVTILLLLTTVRVIFPGGAVAVLLARIPELRLNAGASGVSA
jgi:hypothetical protein